MCADVGTEPSLPRRCSWQIHRSNIPADTPSEYYCCSVLIPMLDHLLSEMKTCFTTHQKTALLGLYIVPFVMVTLPNEECTSKVSQLADTYQDNLPSPDSILSELQCWQMKWQHHLREHGQTSLPVSPTTTIRHTSAMYPNIRALISILCIYSSSDQFLGRKVDSSVLRPLLDPQWPLSNCPDSLSFTFIMTFQMTLEQL